MQQIHWKTICYYHVMYASQSDFNSLIERDAMSLVQVAATEFEPKAI